MNHIATLGHNLPPTDESLLQDDLALKADALIARHDELLGYVSRIPEKCLDDETAGKLTDLTKLIAACSKSLEGMRIAEKEPFLTKSRLVDGFFKRYTDSLDKAKKTVLKPLETYLREKEAEARRKAAEEAQRQREAAEKLAREAQEQEQARMNALAEQTIGQAVRTEAEAVKSEKVANAAPAELARTRGTYGGLSTLRTRFVGTITNREALDLEALRPHLSLDDLQKAVNRFVAAGGRELKGATISEESTAMVR